MLSAVLTIIIPTPPLNKPNDCTNTVKVPIFLSFSYQFPIKQAENNRTQIKSRKIYRKNSPATKKRRSPQKPTQTHLRLRPRHLPRRLPRAHEAWEKEKCRRFWETHFAYWISWLKNKKKMKKTKKKVVECGKQGVFQRTWRRIQSLRGLPWLRCCEYTVKKGLFLQGFYWERLIFAVLKAHHCASCHPHS